METKIDKIWERCKIWWKDTNDDKFYRDIISSLQTSIKFEGLCLSNKEAKNSFYKRLEYISKSYGEDKITDVLKKEYDDMIKRLYHLDIRFWTMGGIVLFFSFSAFGLFLKSSHCDYLLYCGFFLCLVWKLLSTGQYRYSRYLIAHISVLEIALGLSHYIITPKLRNYPIHKYFFSFYAVTWWIVSLYTFLFFWHTFKEISKLGFSIQMLGFIIIPIVFLIGFNLEQKILNK